MHGKFDELEEKLFQINQKLDDICDQGKKISGSMASIMEALKTTGLKVAEVEWKLVEAELKQIAEDLNLPESHPRVAITFYKRDEERRRASRKIHNFPDLDFDEKLKS